MKFDKTDLYYVNLGFQGKRLNLFEIAKWKNGLAFKNIEFADSGVPIIKIAELNNGINSKTSYTKNKYSDEVYLKNGDLIFSWSGNPETSIDIFKFNMSEGWLNQHIFKVTPNDSLVEKNFFYFLMKYLKPYFKKIASNKQTTGLGHVTISDLKRMSLNLPPLNTQKKIAAVLSALDDKIELNNAINKNLEEQAQAIYKNMFPAVISNETSVGEYVIPKRGKSLSAKNAIRGDVPVVAGGLEPAFYHNSANTKSPVITISASGNAGYVRLWNIPVWSSDSSFIDSSITEDVYFWYVMLKLRQQEIFHLRTGTAQQHIYPKHIAQLPVKKLDEHRVTAFTERVTPLFSMMGANTQENQKLGELRDALLPRLMSGEIDVSAVEI